MSIAYEALNDIEREAVDEAVAAANAKLSDLGINVPHHKLIEAIEEALAGVVLEAIKSKAAQPKQQLKLIRTDNGFARVYYRGPEARLYCFLQQSRSMFELFRCTKSGEPNYPVEIGKFEIDLVPEGECSTAAAFRAWHAGRA